MTGDSVRRTGSVPTMGGFAGHHADEAFRRRPDQGAEPESGPSRRDEVSLRSDPVAVLGLLRERVLARTRERLGLGDLQVQAFAAIVREESVGEFLSRLISDQNLLLAHAAAAAGGGERRAAFAEGLLETRELLDGVGGGAAALVDRVEAEFDRRLAAAGPGAD